VGQPICYVPTLKVTDHSMASSLLGRVGEFDSTVESWQQYVERLGHFLDANGINDGNKKRSVLLSVVGPATYKLLTSLIALLWQQGEICELDQ